MSKHIPIYARVSSRSQDTASQEPDLKRWAEGQEAPVAWYRDRFTGKTMDRPGWNKLMKAVRRARCRRGRLAARSPRQDRQGADRAVRGPPRPQGQPRHAAGWARPGDARRSADGERPGQSWRSTRPRSGPSESSPARRSPGRGVRFGRPEGTGKRIKVTPEQEETIPRLKAEGKSRRHRPRRRAEPADDLFRPGPGRGLSDAGPPTCSASPSGLTAPGVRPARVDGRRARAGRGHLPVLPLSLSLTGPPLCPADRGPLNTLLCPPGQFVHLVVVVVVRADVELLPGLGDPLDTVAHFRRWVQVLQNDPRHDDPQCVEPAA